METKVIGSKTAINSINKANPVTEENKNPKFVAGNTVNKDSVKPEAEKPKEEPKAQEQPKVEPKAEPKAEAKKPVLNLEGTLKLVEELHRKKIQRDKLYETINNLDAFEVSQKDEAEENGTPNFSRCELTIEDDKGRSFSTKNPVIIFHVTQYVNALCVDKLAQIEAGITLPA